ncbi:hypothetical protein BY458DRAFT_488776 [Sporodiniella umbellata]|nr:hypothetical protein BY458DRAFT_488776 [Sporodiniella umbellata]
MEAYMLSLVFILLYSGYEFGGNKHICELEPTVLLNVINETQGFQEHMHTRYEFGDIKQDHGTFPSSRELNDSGYNYNALLIADTELDSIFEENIDEGPYLQFPDPLSIHTVSILNDHMFLHFVVGFAFSSILHYS